ncbi:MAG: hypothetical protein WCK90_00335, partial [archaeon]
MKNLEKIKFEDDICFIFRNNGTGNPTLKHILKYNQKAYCGFSDEYYSDVIVNDKNNDVYSIDVCKKCLSFYNKLKTLFPEAYKFI